ncbi:hypothetical protein [Ruminococcus sp.]|uniref:hypothetical protein n=1 Tax=Ruminococcus sp. TaxID=41978 RepID=UPI0025D27278|nr:hypothetical protein [Ruminococcus sp.]MCR4638960.1 hypothetical protein [Ruminococcus sp.]
MSVSNKTTRKTKRKSNLKGLKAVYIILLFTLIVVSIVLLLTSCANAKSASRAAFSNVFNDTKKKTYDQFKQKSFDYFEEQNHVSNRAKITIGNIKEENSLEVLSVSDSWVKISDPEEDEDRTTRWVEFNATGVYTVDMSISEFIIDDYNNFILVKLKTPQLNHIALDNNTKAYLYKYEKGFFELNGDYDSGVQMMLNDRAEALDNLTEQLENNDENLARAKMSTENLIRTFIKNINPELNLKDSDIQIEFI